MGGVSEQSAPERPDGGGPREDERVRGGGRPARRGPRRAVRRGTEREDVPGPSADERGGHEPNDERLRRDVPPHW